MGIWAHRQALAARDAGAEVRVLVLHRLIPPRSSLAGGPPPGGGLRAPPAGGRAPGARAARADARRAVDRLRAVCLARAPALLRLVGGVGGGAARARDGAPAPLL